MLFFSDPTVDLNVIIFFSAVALVISIGIYIFTKKLLLSITLLSILTNLIFFGNVDYRFAVFFKALWLFKFVRMYWPIINIILFAILIFNYFKNKNAEKK